ncbi:MAG: ferritin family protein [Bacteroidales bacterium]|nr:ferritin family protein [Bacteroidales bacterium]
MNEFTNTNDILDFAIQNEQNAVEFYNELAKTARTEDMRSTFSLFAQEEMGHKARLIKIREEGIFNLPIAKVTDLKIADYVVRTEPKADMSYEQTLVLAMKREKAAFKLYIKLSEKAPNEDLKKLFLGLAQEESRHKLRFELEYDEFVLKEN